jgi:hypothetical protein
MWHAWGRGEVFTGFWLRSPKVRDHWEDLGVGGRITLRWTLVKFVWLRIGSRIVFDKLRDYQLFK